LELLVKMHSADPPDPLKAARADFVALAVIEFADTVTMEKPPSRWARKFSGPKAQSAKSLGHDAILAKVLESNKKDIGRPADFREFLPDGPAKISASDLSDNMARLVREGLLQRNEERKSTRPGRPPAKARARRRGPRVNYRLSTDLDIINSVLSDSDCVNRITALAVSSGALYKFARYSMKAALLQAKKDPAGFLKSHEPFCLHPFDYRPKLDLGLVPVQNLSAGRIDGFADEYARQYVRQSAGRPDLRFYKLAAEWYVARLSLANTNWPGIS
jgi:hypothetical protein